MGAPVPGPIPWRDVMHWADRQGYGEAETTLLDTAIQALDGVWLEHEAKQRTEQAKREAAKNANAPHRRR